MNSPAVSSRRVSKVTPSKILDPPPEGKGGQGTQGWDGDGNKFLPVQRSAIVSARHQYCYSRATYYLCRSASEMTYIVSSGALNSTHSLTHLCRRSCKRCNRRVLRFALCFFFWSHATALSYWSQLTPKCMYVRPKCANQVHISTGWPKKVSYYRITIKWG